MDDFHSQSLGADLVAVETSEENDFIKEVVDVSDRDMPNSQDYWVLGAKKRASKREYFWVQTGNPIGFGDWSSAEPDYGQNTYIYMDPRNSNRKWKAWGGYEHNIICETSTGVFS